ARVFSFRKRASLDCPNLKAQSSEILEQTLAYEDHCFHSHIPRTPSRSGGGGCNQTRKPPQLRLHDSQALLVYALTQLQPECPAAPVSVFRTESLAHAQYDQAPLPALSGRGTHAVESPPVSPLPFVAPTYYRWPHYLMLSRRVVVGRTCAAEEDY
ncbi:hypothetical protein B0H12DRAFT_1149073, partial [Mycena haematopus]